MCIRDRYIISNYNFNNNLHVIHNGVDESYFNDDKLTNKDKMINKYNLHGCFIVSSIGRFTELKDFETFIEGIELANKTNPDIRGIISGYVSMDKRDYYNKIKKLIKDKNLEKIIYIILDIPDVRLIYSISNVIVSCSKKPESFGLTLIESLFMNTPVISTKHGGPIDIILENKNGYFIEPNNASQLASLISNPNKFAFNDLRKNAISKYTSLEMFKNYQDIYLETKN